MADITREVTGIFSKKFKDMGDGTHAEVVYVGGEAAGAASDVNANLQVGDADVDGDNPVPTDAVARAFDDGLTHTPAADTAAVVTLAAAGEGVSNVIRGVAWGYSEAPTDGSLTIEDGAGTTVFSVPITAAGPGFIPVFGKGSANKALVVTLAAGGGTCVGSVNVLEAWTE